MSMTGGFGTEWPVAGCCCAFCASASTDGGSTTEDFSTNGGKWGASGTLGNAGGVVTWSLVGAGRTNQIGVGFFSGSTVALSSFLGFDFTTVLHAAFNSWSAVANIEFLQINDGGGNIGVGTQADIRVMGGFIDGPSNVLARAFLPASGGSAAQGATNGDMVFDSGETTFWNATSFFLVAAHEIGHALGLNHENVNLALMNPFFNSALSGLQTDDINGIRAVYGTQDFGSAVYTLPASLTSFTVANRLSAHESFNGLTIVGNALNNTITGSNLAEVIFGGDGNDTLNGGGGNDVLKGEAGADTLSGGSGADQLEGSTNNDILFGGDDNDVLFGGQGNDSLSGDNGNDYLYGGDDADSLYGGNNEDWLEGGNGNDFLYGQEGADVLLGDTGDDYLIGDNGNDVLKGGDGFDYLIGGNGGDYSEGGGGGDSIYGQEGNDVLLGEAGNDVIVGEGGNDILFGGAGSDQLYGGTGVDQFVWQTSLDLQGVDTIFDFQAGAGGDFINLDTLLGNAGFGGANPVAAGYLTWQQVGANTHVFFDLNGGNDQNQLFLNLANVNAGQISLQNNFIV